jgi:ABC-type multidrug transport system fused ATPase/permease subunit
VTVSRPLALRGLLRRHAVSLAFSAILLAVGAAVPAAAVFVLRDALAHLEPGPELLRACLVFLGLTALQAALRVARAVSTRRIAASIASSLRRQLHAKWMEAPDGFVGDRIAGLLDEADQVQYAVSACVGLFRDPLVVAGLLAAAAVLAPPLAVPAALAAMPIVVAAALGGRLVRGATHAARTARAELATLAGEQLAGVELVRAYGAAADERRRFAAADDRDRAARVRLEVLRLVPGVLVQILAAAAVGLLLALGGAFVSAGVLSAPDLVAFVVALVLLTRPLASLSESVALLHRARAALERVELALAAGPGAPAGTRPVPDGPLELTWDAVTVRVGDRTVLDACSLTARPGAIVAVAGPTGAGKTTLLQLGAGLRTCDGGRVVLGGEVIGDLEPRALRRVVAVVAQDTVLFARSVAENVALGETPDRVRVEAALRDAGAGFVHDLPRGADTVLAERGRGLSGGERQRIALARALYRGARVLLLDEPTSQVDAPHAARFGEVLRALAPGRTIVVAAHDPVVWACADHVVQLA